MLTAIILLVIGFFFLIKGADLLVEGSSSVAKKLNISNLVIGLTIVAFGTSAPELVVNLVSSFNGSTDIAIGNIIGSNILNIFLILGIVAIIRPVKVTKNTVWKEIPFSLLGVLLILVLSADFFLDGRSFSAITRIDGLVLLSFFVIFIYYTFVINKKSNEEVYVTDKPKKLILWKSILFIVLGITGLVLGGKWVVNGAIVIAERFGMSQSLIGLTVVAIGTSLPELATSIVAVIKRNVDIAVGNIVGSNIFNIFFVLGISATVKSLPFDGSSIVDVIVACLASILLFIFMFMSKKHTLDRWQGILFILIYVVYIFYIIVRG